MRADSWYFKNMDEKHDDPDGSGVQLLNTVHMINTLHIQNLIHTAHTQTEIIFSGIRLNM
jgi:hypothetical protein